MRLYRIGPGDHICVYLCTLLLFSGLQGWTLPVVIPLKCRTVNFPDTDPSTLRSERACALGLRRSKSLESTHIRVRTPALSDYDAEATNDVGSAPNRILHQALKRILLRAWYSVYGSHIS